jgi:hypothetical protein
VCVGGVGGGSVFMRKCVTVRVCLKVCKCVCGVRGGWKVVHVLESV